MRGFLWMSLFLYILAGCGNLQQTATPEEIEITPTHTSAAFQPFIVNRVFPTSTPVCTSAPETRLIVGERGRVSTGDTLPLNVREGPGIAFKAIGTLKLLETFLVLEGPECSGDYAWYYVRSIKMTGWIAEGDRNVYYVEPYLPG